MGHKLLTKDVLTTIHKPDPVVIGTNDILTGGILRDFLFQHTTSGDVIAQEVASYPTLKELEAHEVEKAFWVGYTLGQYYWKNPEDQESDQISGILHEMGATEIGCQKM